MQNDKIHLLPFGCDRDSYDGLLELRPGVPNELGVVVSLLTSGHNLMMEPNFKGDMLGKLKSALRILDGRPVGNGNATASFHFSFERMPNPLHFIMLEQQKEWLLGDTCVQVGFTFPDRFSDPGLSTSLAVSMTIYDFLVLRHNSIHPVDHEPLEMRADHVRELRVAMGQHFQEGSFLLNHGLLQYRNKVATMCRAAIAGEDPIQAYQEYLMESRTYFLPFEQNGFAEKFKTFVTVEGGPESPMWCDHVSSTEVHEDTLA